jgi:tetratricopeptide (TPR) repeat protein
MLEYHFFQLDPQAYHLTNLLLHCSNGVLVFLLISSLSGNFLVGLVVSLLFAIHPLRVESVAWIAERKDVLASLFYLLSLIWYVRYLKTGGRRFFYFCMVSFLLSLLSKPMAVTLPLIMLLIDYLNDKKPDIKALVEKVPFFAVAVVFGVITILTQRDLEHVLDYPSLTLVQRTFVPFYGTAFYLLKSFVPVNLCAYYSFTSALDSGMHLSMFASAFLVAGIAAAVYYSRRYSKTAVFGSLFFLINLLPVLHLVPFGDAIVAERYTYIPMIGIVFIVAEAGAFALRKMAGNKPVLKAAAAAVVGALVILFTFMTRERCAVWKDGISLWNDVIKKFPSAAAYVNRGVAYSSLNDNSNALEDYNQALRLNPNSFYAYNNRGVIYKKKGDYDRAIKDYDSSIALNPDYAAAYCNRAFIQIVRGAVDEAIKDCCRAISLNPKFADAFNNLGIAHCKKSSYDRGIENYSRAIELNNHYFEAYYNRGLAYRYKGELGPAIEDFSRLIAFNCAKFMPQAFYSRGLAYEARGDYSSAHADLKRACALGYDAACGYCTDNQ